MSKINGFNTFDVVEIITFNEKVQDKDHSENKFE